MMERISVVLPAPLRPTRLTMAPLATCIEKPRSAGIDWISTTRCSISSIGATAFTARPGGGAAHFRILQDMGRVTIGENWTLDKSHHPGRLAAEHLPFGFDADNGWRI